MLDQEVWERRLLPERCGTGLKPQFDCTAFVSVSSTPDIKKVFKDMLLQLDKQKYENIHNQNRDEKQLIDELRDFLNSKRYTSRHLNSYVFCYLYIVVNI